MASAGAKYPGGGGTGKKGKGWGPPPNPKGLDQAPVPADPENCCICISPIDSRCRANGDSCSHQFCYQCLLTWSKTNAVCPLCMRTFTKILHNYTIVNGVELHDVFEVPFVPPPQEPSPQTIHEFLTAAFGPFFHSTWNGSGGPQTGIGSSPSGPIPSTSGGPVLAGGAFGGWNFSFQVGLGGAGAGISMLSTPTRAGAGAGAAQAQTATAGPSSSTSTAARDFDSLSHYVPIPPGLGLDPQSLSLLRPNRGIVDFHYVRQRPQPTIRPPPPTSTRFTRLESSRLPRTYSALEPSAFFQGHQDGDGSGRDVSDEQGVPEYSQFTARPPPPPPPPTATARRRPIVTIDLTEDDDEAAAGSSPALSTPEAPDMSSSEVSVSTTTSTSSESADSDDEVQIIYEGPIVKGLRPPPPTITFDSSDEESVQSVVTTEISSTTTSSSELTSSSEPTTTSSEPTTHEDEVDRPSSRSPEPSTSAEAQKALLDRKRRNRKRRAIFCEVLQRKRLGLLSRDLVNQSMSGSDGNYLIENERQRSRSRLEQAGSGSETPSASASAPSSNSEEHYLDITRTRCQAQVSLTRLSETELASYGIIQDEDNEMAMAVDANHNYGPSVGGNSGFAAAAATAAGEVLEPEPGDNAIARARARAGIHYYSMEMETQYSPPTSEEEEEY